MAGSINKVVLVGNLGRDPEVRHTATGAKIVHLSVATSDMWKDKNGERQEKTEWHRVVVFNTNLADFAERNLRKGMKVYVEGSLQTRKFQDASGQDKFSTEIVLGSYRGELVAFSNSGDGSAVAAESGDGAAEPTGDAGWDSAPAAEGETFNDEIPF